MIDVNNNEDMMTRFHFFYVQFDIIADVVEVHVMLDVKDQAKTKIKTHSDVNFVH
jgi:hypothetical protein